MRTIRNHAWGEMLRHSVPRFSASGRTGAVPTSSHYILQKLSHPMLTYWFLNNDHHTSSSIDRSHWRLKIMYNLVFPLATAGISSSTTTTLTPPKSRICNSAARIRHPQIIQGCSFGGGRCWWLLHWARLFLVKAWWNSLHCHMRDVIGISLSWMFHRRCKRTNGMCYQPCNHQAALPTFHWCGFLTSFSSATIPSS